MSVTNVRRISSKVLMRYQAALNERGANWENVEWEEFELESGPGGDTGNTTVQIINSNPVWKEVFEEQRKGVGASYCDVQIHGCDGFIPAHVIYLQHVSGLVDSLIKSLPPGTEPPTPQNILGITLADTKVDHIRTVLSLVYSGAASVDRENLSEIRKVMDTLQINDVVLEEEPLNQGQVGGKPNKFRQVLIYRLRETRPNLKPTTGQQEAILPAPVAPPLSSTATASCQPSISVAKSFKSKSYTSISTGGKNFNKAREKDVTRDVEDDLRYPKRSSKSLVSYNENQDSDLDIDEEIGKKKIKTEMESDDENSSSPPQDDPKPDSKKVDEKEKNHVCFFCNGKYKTEDELDSHLRAQCGRSLEEFFDLEDRFCNACKCSYKDHDAVEFISHVGTCVGTMHRRRGNKRKSTSNKSDQDDKQDKNNSCDEDPPVEIYHARMSMVCVDELSKTDVTKVMNMVENEKPLKFKRPPAEYGFMYAFPEGQTTPAQKAIKEVEAAEAIRIEIEQAMTKKRGPKSRTIGKTESLVIKQPLNPAEVATAGTQTGKCELNGTKIFKGEEIIFCSNSSNTDPASKAKLKDSSNSTASPSNTGSNSLTQGPPNTLVDPPPLNALKDIKPSIFVGPGNKTIVEFVVIHKHVCQRCFSPFQSESSLQSHMDTGSCT